MAKTDTKRCRKKVKGGKDDGVDNSEGLGNEDYVLTESTVINQKEEDPIEQEAQTHDENPETKMEQEIGEVKDEQVSGKRKAGSNVETSPSKKPRIINDGFCLFVGNLNFSKTSEEIIDTLSTYLMTQSLLVQNIRLDKSRKFAYVDVASELDLIKALKLNEEIILEKPMRIAKAKVKSEDKVKVKAPLDQKVIDARCLFLRNIPYSATKKQILKIFHKAIAVRFPGGAKSPTKGVAFVEFRNKKIASKVLQKKQGVKIQGRALILDHVGEAKVILANKEDKNGKVPSSNTLFVGKLPYGVSEKTLKNAFQNAVSINIPQNEGKSKGFAFVEFATVADAEKALQSSQNLKISKKAVKVQFSVNKANNAKVNLKTLVVMGLAEKTSAETLKSAFEGPLSARVIVDQDTGVSKRFGFVEFDSEENCRAAKEAMEDCEIDGSKVTVAYAIHKDKSSREGLVARPGGKPAGRPHGAGTLQDPVEEVESKD